MYRDSCIAEYFIEHFTKRDVPILCMHDSFIVTFDQVLELRAVMTEAGANIAKRFMFTDKQVNGVDEWLAEYDNTGVRPNWDPREPKICKGYIGRRKLFTGGASGNGLMSKE